MTQSAEIMSPTAPADSREPMLEVRGLTKSFGGLSAVAELDLKVFPREIVSIIGPNGAGKTTVFNLITGLYQPNGTLEGQRGRFGAGLVLVGRRLGLVIRKRPAALLRWLLGTLLGMGLGTLFIVYVLNVLIDAALSDESYLHNAVLICVIAWLVF